MRGQCRVGSARSVEMLECVRSMQKAKSKKANQRQTPDANGSTSTPAHTGGRGRSKQAEAGSEKNSLADAQALGLIKSQAGLDLTEKVKDLLRLAKEQGHLTYEDVNE